MAFDPEELQKRRQQRQEKRKKQQKRTVILLSALALALCAGIVIAVIALLPNNGTPRPSESTTDTRPPDTVIRLAAVGDLNITKAVTESGGNTDYTKTFMDVAHLLADPDITLVNFEGNLCGAPYGTDRSAPQALANALRSAGVDMVQLANSFSIYKGMDGLADTISGIRSAGMEPLGVYANAADAKAGKGYTIRTVNGIKIAFVAFTKGMDGMAMPAGNEHCVNVLYNDYASTYQEVDVEGITAVLSAAAKEKPDLIVAMLHWGSEFNDTISNSQTEIRDLLLANGVDAIIGTHSHYVQKIELDETAGTLTAYSLGDFVGDASRSGTEYSVVLELEIRKDSITGETRVAGYSYTPIFTVAEEGKPLRVLRIQEAISAYESGYLDRVSQKTYEAMKYALTRIEARINAE